MYPINFTISIAIGGTVQNLLMANLEPYGINSDDFMKASNLSSTLTHLCVSKFDYDLIEELLLPALLQEAGKFILADIITSDKKTEEFKTKVAGGEEATAVEKELVGLSSSEITAKIFRHWKLSDNLINVIEFVDDISKCDDSVKQKAQILDVIKTACNVSDPLSDENVEKAVAKAASYGLHTKSLEKAIEKYKSHYSKTDIKHETNFDFAQLQNLLSSQNQEFKERFVVKIGDKIKAIPTKEIAFFYSESKATFAQDFNGKSYLIDFSLDQLLDILNPKKYYRLNRKYIASFESIEDMRAYSNSRIKLVLKNCGDKDILMSREKVSDFKEWLNQ